MYVNSPRHAPPRATAEDGRPSDDGGLGGRSDLVAVDDCRQWTKKGSYHPEFRDGPGLSFRLPRRAPPRGPTQSPAVFTSAKPPGATLRSHPDQGVLSLITHAAFMFPCGTRSQFADSKTFQILRGWSAPRRRRSWRVRDRRPAWPRASCTGRCRSGIAHLPIDFDALGPVDVPQKALAGEEVLQPLVPLCGSCAPCTCAFAAFAERMPSGPSKNFGMAVAGRDGGASGQPDPSVGGVRDTSKAQG